DISLQGDDQRGVQFPLAVCLGRPWPGGNAQVPHISLGRVPSVGNPVWCLLRGRDARVLRRGSGLVLHDGFGRCCYFSRVRLEGHLANEGLGFITGVLNVSYWARAS